ncbi:MAG: FAD-dependent oxidoreductase [Myxococcales bacterium]|nr:FAD-dependent oxidoreductase [Myxococcales bacterium]MCB9534291.1 FAD-dependent oxidoreductase [Myxococcales bacterium]
MRLVIIGNGVAGVTCAMEVRKRDPSATITLVSGETDYFFSRTALMYAFMDRMTRRGLEPFERHVYDELRIERVRAWAMGLQAQPRAVVLEGGRTLEYDRLVIATGAVPNRFNWDGLDDARDGVVHFVSMQDLDACERLAASTREAVVVGGGLIGVELVESLVHHGVKVTFLIREPWYWPMAIGREEADFVTEHLRAHGVDVALEEQMTRVEVDAAGRVRAVRTDKGRELPCQLLGLAVGVRPATDRLAGFEGLALNRGVVVDEQLRTSMPDVFACGDCARITPRSGTAYNELIWYSAKRQGAIAARNVLGDGVAYEPPIFFNSSKFFEIEYTTVGAVMSAPATATSLYRRLPGAPVSQRIVSDQGRVIGFNMLGSRWDHAVLERWIAEGRDESWVAAHLAEAQYDVEFGRARLDRMTSERLPITTEVPA